MNEPRPITLEPRDRKLGPDSHWLNTQASAWWSDGKTLERRTELIPQLLLRKRVGTRAEPCRRTQGLYLADDIEEAQKERREHVAADIMRLMAWAHLHCDWRSHKIGAWREGRIHYPTRCQIADGAGFEVLMDSKHRVRAWTLDDRIDDAIAAGLLFRLVDKNSEGRPSIFKLTALAWQLCGMAMKRAIECKKAAKKEKEAARPTTPPVPAVAALVSSLATTLDARRPGRDSYYESAAETPHESRGWKRRKPPP